MLLMLCAPRINIAHRAGSASAKDIAETVQNFITAMDTIKLKLIAIDQV